MTPYTPGDRVVCPDPDDGWFAGTVAHIDTDGYPTVTYSPTQVMRFRPSEVRPAMPRDRHDLERWGRWWWRNERPVWMTWTLSGVVWSPSPGWAFGSVASASDLWSGPVAPPPEVRP